MRWRVIGADSRTGKEMKADFEARTAEEAANLARYNGIYVSDVRDAAAASEEALAAARLAAMTTVNAQLDQEYAAAEVLAEVPTPVASPAVAAVAVAQPVQAIRPPPMTRVAWGSGRWRVRNPLLSLFAVIGIVATAIYAASLALRQDPVKVASSMINNAAGAPIAPVDGLGRLSYEQIVQGIGGEFTLAKEPLMDWTTKYVGTSESLQAVLLLTGQPDDIRYAHVGVVLTAPLNAALRGNALGGATGNDELSMSQFALMVGFLRRCVPAWAGGKTWLAANLGPALRGQKVETFTHGIRVKLVGTEGSPAIRLIVEPM